MGGLCATLIGRRRAVRPMRARRTGRAPPGARGALAWPILGPPPRAPGERRPRRRRCATTELANFAAANLGANRPPWSVVHSSLDAHSCRSAPTTRSPVPWSLVDLFCQPHTYTHTPTHTLTQQNFAAVCHFSALETTTACALPFERLARFKGDSLFSSL